MFALFGRVGRSPRVYAASDRESILRAIQTAALAKMGMTLAGRFIFAYTLEQAISNATYMRL